MTTTTVTVEGLVFERSVRRGTVIYVAQDGERLRSVEAVKSYLLKCGMGEVLERALASFTFDDSDSKSSPSKLPQDGAAGVAGNAPDSKGKTVVKRKRAEEDDADKATATKVEQEEEPEWKARNRRIAQTRAAAFARGQGFKDDVQMTKKAKGPKAKAGSGAAEASDGKEQKKESWPGPYATANQLYKKRDAAAAQKAAGGGGVTVVQGRASARGAWVPRGRGKGRGKAAKVTALQDMCVQLVAANIEACMEAGLGDVLPDIKARLCEELSLRRRLRADVLPLFTSEPTPLLRLPDCSYLTESDLAAAFQRCQGEELEELELKFCGRGLGDRLLEQLTAASTNLHTLRVGGCYRLTDKGIAAALQALPRLRGLEVSDCAGLSGASVRVLEGVAGTLEGLALAGAAQLSEEDLLPLRRLTALKRLSLAGNKAATDRVVAAVVEGCGGTLEELDLSHGQASGFSAEPEHCLLSDAALGAIGAECRGLRRLVLRNVDTVTDEGVAAVAEGCAGLTELDLTRCKALSDAGLAAVARHCVQLQRLSLNAAGSVTREEEQQERPQGGEEEEEEEEEDGGGLGGGKQRHGITDEGLLALEEGAACRSGSLRELDLSWCRGVTEDGLGFLVDKAPGLRRLVLRGCAQISDVFLGGHSGEQLEVWGRDIADCTLKPAPVHWSL